MIRVLVITTVEFNPNGITSVILNFYNKLKEKIHFDFIASRGISIDVRNCIDEKSKVFVCSNRMKQPISYYFEIKQIIENGNYDIVHIHGNSTTMSLELFAIGNKSKKIVHGHNVKTNFKILNKLLYPYFKKKYDLALAPSKEAGEFLYKNREFIILENGIDVKKFEYDSKSRIKIRKKYSIKDNEKIILCVANFNVQKKQSLLLKILSKILTENNEYKIFFVGDGKLLLDTKKLSEKYHLTNNVFFIGSINDVEKYYSAADYFALPTNFESFGLVALEAQINGLPVIVSDTVPKSVNITKKVVFAKNNDISEWIKFFYNEKRHSVKNEDFESMDIKNTSEKLNNYYLSAIDSKIKE